MHTLDRSVASIRECSSSNQTGAKCVSNLRLRVYTPPVDYI